MTGVTPLVTVRLRWPSALWLAAKGGRSDRTRIVLTAAGASAGTLALLSAITVAYTGPDDGPYTSDLLNQPGLHPGIVIAFVLLCIPVLGFVGQCARVGAPARDRRLAAFRLSGATPSDATRIACAESGLAAFGGAALGLAAYLALRALLDTPVIASYTTRRIEGDALLEEQVTGPVLRLPTDVLPPTWVLAGVVVAIPVAAVMFSAIALRRVTVSPFGVSRDQRSRPPQLAPAVLFVVGSVGMATFSGLMVATGFNKRSIEASAAVFLVLFALAGVGLVAGSASLAYLIGRILAPRSRRPAVIIAARRLMVAPFEASRATAAVLLTVLLGAFAQGVRKVILTITDPTETFYANALNLVDLAIAVALLLAVAGLLVSAAEGIVTRRRSLAALAALGTPRGVLQRAVVLQSLLPLVPTTVLAAIAGILAARGVFGSTAQLEQPNPSGEGEVALRAVSIPVPWTELTVLVLMTLLLTLLVTSASLLFLRSSTDPAELRTTA